MGREEAAEMLTAETRDVVVLSAHVSFTWVCEEVTGSSVRESTAVVL